MAGNSPTASGAALLVTGAAGFIGARFVEACAARGIERISVDDIARFDDRPEHRGIAFGTRVDREQLFEWLGRERPRLAGIVHLGACSDTLQLDVDYLRRVNVEYSQHLWRYAVEAGIPFVYASSAATYGDGSLGYDDDEALIPRLRPLNPYGESKQRFDLWALAQEGGGAHPPGWCGFKFFNVYGFGERHKGRMASVVLHAFDQIRASGRARLFRSYRPDIADGYQTRDFICVEDVVEVLFFALAGGPRRGIYNLGTGLGRTFLDLVRATFAALQVPEQIDFVDMPSELRERYQYFTEARMERLRAAGWERPFTSLEAGVRVCVERLLRAAG
jgi:ADP-L-glycero-D-manno-heptose 6-epimerase